MVHPSAAASEELAILSKIISACGLTEGADCVTVGLTGPSSLAPPAVGAQQQWLIAFGVQARSFGVVAEVPMYTWTPLIGRRRYCFAERLSLIGEDPARKKRLWNAIKGLKP